jgi:hypothetical protein
MLQVTFAPETEQGVGVPFWVVVKVATTTVPAWYSCSVSVNWTFVEAPGPAFVIKAT